MMRAIRLALLAALLGGVPARAAEPAAAYAPAADPAVAARQRDAYDVVHRYKTLLNAGDTGGILDLFAPEGVAEWNNVHREVFVLRRVDGRYRIALYTFNTDPVQGEG